MQEAKPQTLLWTVPSCPYRVLVDASLINEIRIAVVEAFYSVPRGGVEIGGVFFGSRNNQTLHIAAHRSIKCEYVTGPSFTLSVKDQIGLAGVLAAPDLEPELSGMVPLGWYHSHTRSRILLSAADLVLYNEFFPERWQIAMVLRPANLQPTSAAFFFRDDSGHIVADPPVQEFIMEPPAYGLTPVGSVASDIDLPDAATFSHAARAVAATGAAAAAVAAELPASRLETIAPQEETGRELEIGLPSFDRAAAAPSGHRWRGWLFTVLATSLLLLAAAFAYVRWYRVAKPVDLGLETYDVRGAFLIRWDRDSAVIRGATHALLEIQDGPDTTPVELSQGDLALGGYGYMRRSSAVSVHMKVEGQVPADEYSNFKGSQSLMQPSDDSAHSDKNDVLARVTQEKEHLKTELINQSMQIQELRATAAELRRQLAAEKSR